VKLDENEVFNTSDVYKLILLVFKENQDPLLEGSGPWLNYSF